jgi:hypothetical protein
MSAGMNKTDCPGLKWRKRKDGTRAFRFGARRLRLWPASAFGHGT